MAVLLCLIQISTYRKCRLQIQREVKIMNKYESIIIVNPNVDEAGLKALEEKLKKFFKENDFQILSYSYDFYNENESFITIHGLNSAAFANNIVAKIQADKSGESKQTAIVVTNQNYKVIQIKKNLNAYLVLKNQ